jgi:hypothetical protein
MKKYVFLSFLFFSLFTHSFGQDTSADYQKLFDTYQNNGEVYFEIVSDIEIERVSKVVDIDRREHMEQIFAYANKKQFLSLESENIKVKMHQHPGTLIQPKMLDKVNIKNIKDWDFYPTYDAYVEMMYQFASDYPTLCRLEVIGESEEGRSLLACVISDNAQLDPGEKQFLYTSTMHGDETTGYVLLLRLIDYFLTQYGSNAEVTNLVDNLEIWINPNANPDGTYASGNNTVYGATRENANGVNLNRNYADPEDGPHPDGNEYQAETLAFMALAENNEFFMSANIHGGAEVCNYPWDTWYELHPEDEWWKMVCHEYADTAQFYSPPGYMDGFDDGITNGAAWYSIAGGRQDYMNWFHDCSEFTLEISDTKLLPESQLDDHWEYNYRSLINYMKHSVTTGVGESEQFDVQFSVSPNPVSNLCRVQYNGVYNGDVQLKLIGAAGTELLSKKITLEAGTDFELNLEEVPKGIYVLTLSGRNINISRKIIKE